MLQKSQAIVKKISQKYTQKYRFEWIELQLAKKR